MCNQIYSNIIQVFTLFMKAIFSQVRHPSHPGRGHASPTCHMTQFEQSDWLRSENFTNIMMELLTTNLDCPDSQQFHAATIDFLLWDFQGSPDGVYTSDAMIWWPH